MILNYNGNDLPGDIGVLGWSVSTPTLTPRVVDVPGVRGKIRTGGKLGNRAVTIRMVLLGDTTAACLEALDALNGWCHADEPKPLLLPGRADRYLLAECDGYAPPDLGGPDEEFEVSFICHCPDYIAVAEQSGQDLIRIGGTLSTPIRLEQTLPEALTDPVWTIDGATRTIRLSGGVDAGLLVIDSERGAVTLDGGDVYLNSCCIISARTGLYCDQISRGSWAGFAHYADGYCADRFALAAEAADVAIYGHIPGSPEPLAVVHAARGTTRDITVHSSQSAAAPAYQSATLSGALGWISTKKGWSDGVAYQGYTTGKGECYGCFQFTLPAASSIVSATLTLHRKSSTGKGAPVDVHLYGSATAWGSRPSLGTLYASRADAVLAGNTVSMDVTAAAQALLSGSIAQLVAYEGDGTTLPGHEYSTDYCAWDIATLDITYTQ